ncbi:hypothetical protein BH09MYX1_BH09MYX1_41720 [soil metagenome]
MKRDQRAEDLLRALAADAAPSVDERVARARCDKLVPRLADAIAAQAAARRQKRRLAGSMFALAAAAVIALVGWRFVLPPVASPLAITTVASAYRIEGTTFHLHDGSAALVGDGDGVAAHDELTTSPTGRARVTTPLGLTFELAPASDVRIESVSSASVDAGHVVVFVPTLGADRRASVVLLGALIEIDERASFTVDVDRTAGTAHIKVDEGRVQIRAPEGDVVLGDGEEWPAPTHAAIVPPPPFTMTLAPPLPSAVVVRPKASPTSTSTSVRANALGEQNRLMQSAIDARRGNDPKQALALLDELLTRFPSSPLTQGARAERFLALEQAGAHDAAAKEARAYLAAYPQGFARDEAAALAK